MDRSNVFKGTFDHDPRSENVNTHVGAIIHDAVRAQRVALAIETDMRPENCRDPANDELERDAPSTKWLQARYWQMMSLRVVL